MTGSPERIAMIPARMGSKRIPMKNIRLLCGKPLIQYAIEGTKASGCFDEIWVNSESKRLAELASACGVRFHQRPAHLATDTATNQDFTTEFLQRHPCRYVVMVNPTSPLLGPETIRRFCKTLETNRFDTLLTVVEERAECFFREEPVNFSPQRKINSQDLQPVQKVVWALTAWRRKPFLDLAERGECGVFGGRLGRFSIPLRESCDIDTEEEWDQAKGMLLAEKSNKAGPKEGPEKPVYWRNPHGSQESG